MSPNEDSQAVEASADQGKTTSGPCSLDDPGVIRDVQEYGVALREGKPADRETLLKRYPAVADDLSMCLDALELVHSAVPQLHEQSPSSAAARVEAAAISQSATLGDFRIVREIGCGGMGVVYEGEQISMDRRVALKVLPFAALLDPKHLQRFKNEARAAGSLDHPNIVGVYSVGCERGVHYYAMQYVEGQTLAQVIHQLHHSSTQDAPDDTSDTPTPEPAAASAETDRLPQAVISTEGSTHSTEFFRSVARLGIQAAEALEHAHEMGVIHRDIKPSNLMVDARGHLWITDFGLAMTRSETNLTMTGDVLGTLRYMSPEQVAGKSRVLDHHTDVYSLGVTLYELLTLRPAFPDNDRQKLMRQVAEEDPPSPRQLNRAIPKDLETIVLKAAAKEPKARYDTAQELADDLRRFTEDKPVQARRPSLAERAMRWSRRHRSVVWSAAATLMMAVVALSISVTLIMGNYRVTRRAVDDLLDRVEQTIEDAAMRNDKDQVEKLLEFANELDPRLPKSVRRSPRHRARLASMQYHRAICAMHWREYELAEASSSAAVGMYEQLRAELPGQYDFFLARCHYILAESLWAMDRRQEAEESYRRFLRASDLVLATPLKEGRAELDLDELRHLAHRAGEILNEIEAEKSITELTEAIRQDPNEAGNYKKRAYAYVQVGDFDRAVADYLEAVRCDPEWMVPYYRWPEPYLKEGQIDKLIAAWTRVIKHKPEYAIAYRHRGDAYWFGKCDADSALADHNEAILLAPQDP